jgi:hypothetical protein
MLLGVRVGDRRQDSLARMAARQPEHALNESNGADAAGREGGVGPLFQRGADALALADQAIDKRLLSARGFGLTGPRRKHAGNDASMNGDERVVTKDADEMRVSAHAEFLTEQGERDRIERAAHFHMAIGVDGPLAAREERKRLGGEWLQRCSTSTKCVQTWRRVVP